jgi:O-antigen/teichoic acid export membrane protein
MANEGRADPSEHGSGAAWRAVINASYALLEFAWPIVVSLIATPIIVTGLGPSAFGVLSLVAVTLGLFSLLDLGMGGAAIRAIAQHVERNERDEAAKVLSTVVSTYAAIGVLGAAAIALATPLFVTDVLTIPAELQPDASTAFLIAALGFPVTLIVAAFASVPKAVQRFDLSTRVAVVFTTIGPLVSVALVLAGLGLPAVVAGTLAVNVAMGVAYYRVASRLLAFRGLRLGVDLRILGRLARFGGWFVAASIGVTVLYQLDKLLLGSLLSVAAVTFYVVPGSMANRIQGAVGAGTQIVFPVASALFVQNSRSGLLRLYRDGTRLSFLLAAALSVPMAVFAEPFLRTWLDPGFAQRSTGVMILLVATYALLGLTGVAWGLAFGSGRARINAAFAIGMAILDVALLLILVEQYEITGAAVAYLVSAAVGAPALIAYVERAVLGLSGLEFLVQYARVLPAVAIQAVGALLLRGLAVGLLPTLGLMAITALALPLLYVRLGLATTDDRVLIDQFVARLRRLRPARSR